LRAAFWSCGCHFKKKVGWCPEFVAPTSAIEPCVCPNWPGMTMLRPTLGPRLCGEAFELTPPAVKVLPIVRGSLLDRIPRLSSLLGFWPPFRVRVMTSAHRRRPKRGFACVRPAPPSPSMEDPSCGVPGRQNSNPARRVSAVQKKASAIAEALIPINRLTALIETSYPTCYHRRARARSPRRLWSP